MIMVLLFFVILGLAIVILGLAIVILGLAIVILEGVVEDLDSDPRQLHSGMTIWFCLWRKGMRE